MASQDIAGFKALSGDASMWTYFTSDLSVGSELEKWVNSAVTQMEEKTRLAFTIIDKATHRIAGSSSFGNISERDKRVEIGWTWLGKEYHGKAINNQVKHLMLQYCFEVLKLKRVEFKTDVLNAPARKALSKIGMIEEGVLRSHTLMTHGRRRDTLFYSVLHEEWDATRTKNHWK